MKENDRNSKKQRLLYLIILTFTYSILLGIVIYQSISLSRRESIKEEHIDSDGEALTPSIQFRNHDYKFIRPLRIVDNQKESRELTGIKDALQQIITHRIASSELSVGSVYLREMNSGEWISINSTELYHPGSLVKIPIMMSYLRKEEDNPGFLDTKITFKNPDPNIPKQTFNGKTIELGKSYTIKDLLNYMIKESDNNATFLLLRYMDQPSFQRVFTDLGMDKPRLDNIQYTLNVMQFSRFIRVLFNSSYLNEKNSEYALELLSQCSYDKGLISKLPKNTLVSHKFGEYSDNTTLELSETGLIFLEERPYLLTVMTRGKEINQLSSVIAEISEAVYDLMSKK